MEKINIYIGKIMIIFLLLLTSCFSFLQADNDIDLPEPGTKYNKTSSPIGGGDGYIKTVLKGDADYIVHSFRELKKALSIAEKHEVIFLPGNVEINLSKNEPLAIPPYITLASDRGHRGSEGALLYTESFDNKRMIEVQGDSVRISGLRIEGPDKEVRKFRDGLPRVNGIYVNGYKNLEVDNSEIFGWSFGGVYLSDSKNSFIHHNYIHDNRRTGLGYGVVLYSYDQPTNVLIEANYFTFNRHSIAGSGQLGVSYEARYNYVRHNSNSHSFDMHGDHENPGTGTHYAGNEIKIHHNTFFPKNQGVVVRGIPKEGAWIYENNFLQAEQSAAIRQSNYFGNLHVYDNTFKGEENAWYVSWGGKEDWYALKTSPSVFGIEDTFIGDFNGDKKSDLLVWHRQSGFVSYSDDSHYGHGSLKEINLKLHEESIKHILIGNFVGDKRDEVMKIKNGSIYIGEIASGSWKKVLILRDGTNPEFLRTGDFNGDGKDDIFAFDGTNWFISYNLNGDWVKFKEQKVNPDQILIGKFSSKERDDIIMVEGNQLVQHNFGITPQAEVAIRTTERQGPFLAGDFDGDGMADLLSLENNEININYSQQSSWNTAKSYSDSTTSTFKVGDFNGDEISDIITIEKSLW